MIYLMELTIILFLLHCQEPKAIGLYWATVSLTTMGYGDIYPVTTTGRIVTMLSSVFGIAIIALPSGIITAGFMDELNIGSKKECEEDSDGNT